MADMRMVSQILHRQLRRIRLACRDRRLQRESARTAPIGERGDRGPPQSTAEQHGDDGAIVQPLGRRGVRRVQERPTPNFRMSNHLGA